MKKEVIAHASTVEAAIADATAQLGVSEYDCKIEVIQAPKKTIFGKLKGEAIVKATLEIIDISVEKPAPIEESQKNETMPIDQTDDVALDKEHQKMAIARKYLREILDSMGLVKVVMVEKIRPDGAIITFDGEGIAVLIGHHGETLDALQYLVALTCNRIDGDYFRITLDCGNYRDKRETTLEGLAKRIAQKVIKTGRSQMLEPMNPYERRIIHAVVSDIEGVFSKSKGEEPNRRIVIMCNSQTKTFIKNTNQPIPKSVATPAAKREEPVKKPYVHKPERTMEEILKNDFKDKN